MRKLFQQLHRPIGACDLYRTLLPAKFLKPILKDYGVELVCEFDYTRHPDLSATIIQRHAVAELLVYLMGRQSRGMRVAIDFDDDMLNIPAWSPVCPPEHSRNEISASRIIADRVFASTATLAKTLENWSCAKTKRVLVLPNLLDLQAWSGGLDHSTETDEIRIIWAGSGTHEKDVELLTPVFDVILPKYPHVKLCYFGECVPASWLTRWFDRVNHLEWTPLNNYPRQLRYINPHIGLCPLVDEKFNHSKSAIKASEYTLAGAAVICSPLPPYQIERDPIWEFASTTEQWIEKISMLVEDHEARRRLHGKAIEVVCKNWTWQNSPYAGLWLAAMLDLMDVKPGEKPQPIEEKPAGTSGVADALKRIKGQ